MSAVSAFVSQVDDALAATEELFPALVAPVVVAADVPPPTPAPPGVSGTTSGAAMAAGHYSGQWTYAQSNDELVTAAATAGVEEAAAGRAVATGLRTAAQAQCAAMTPAAEASAAGMRALVAAMDEKLAAAANQVDTSRRRFWQLETELERLSYWSIGAARLPGLDGPGQAISPYSDPVTLAAEREGTTGWVPMFSLFELPPAGNDHIGDERFGYWEDIPGLLLPAHRPPPGYDYDDITGYGLIIDPDTDFYDRLDAATPGGDAAGDELVLGDFRPSTQDNPAVNAPSTGPFIPGKSVVDVTGKTEWVGVELMHQIRVKGTQPTSVTRVQFDPGEYGWKPQRWVSNVLELTETKRGVGDFGRVAGVFDPVDKRPVSVGEVARLSTENWGVKYYVPDSCGGTTMIENGVIASSVPVGRSEPELDFRGAVINDPLPAPPAMTPPQK
jgi:hypothetical protein